SEKSEGISENSSIIFEEFRLDSEGVASVSAVYQFLSLGQKSKVIFVPGSCLLFILSQNFLDIFFNLKKTYD
ncbi:hypothetical protein, partial [Enterococcus faecalis]|uniref:hypothetical protein n=1 Tax=Enterococcus faecalis TaxID=1351 RepID=UPI0021DF621A